MKPWRKRVLIGSGGLLAIGVIVIVSELLFVDFVVDFWWFQSQGLSIYWLLRLAYRYLVLAFFTTVFFGIFFMNFWIASRFVGYGESRRDKDKRDLIKIFRDGMQRFYVPLSFLMALPIAVPMFSHWEETLLFVFGGASGVVDPLFTRDVSFYLFSLPIYNLIQKEVLLVLSILFLGVAFLYWCEHRLLKSQEQALPKRARLHMNLLALSIVAVLCWGFLLERYGLLYKTTNLPIFYGPGYVEMRIILPFIWLCMLLLAAAGISLILFVNRSIGWKAPLVFVLLFALGLMGKNADSFAKIVHKYVVAPNQIVREKPYISANIQSTLAAYGLDDVEIREFKIDEQATFNADDPDLKRRLRNIPVWDKELLGGVFEELQGIRTYYAFPTIDVDRYTVEGNYRQVYLGARETRLSKLPQSAQNWINTHLQYTHGFGIAMIPAAQAGDAFMTWFVKGVPPKSDYGLSSDRMSIYYGLEDKPYVIVPNDAGEIGSSVGDEETIVNYEGQGGVPVSSLWRKLLFALHYKDRNIFYTTRTNDHSRILFRRNIVDQIVHITPFLKLDPDPYIVMTEEGLFWIQDAYTTADNYPLSPPVEGGFNYIRDAVKVVVDAYHGKATYYIAETRDPIINAYHRMYPGIFRPLAEMPESLKKHVRYPKEIFHNQVTIYATYHQQDPERFYRQEDIWEFSKIPQGRSLRAAQPYYLTLDLIQPGKEDFLLFMPFSPFNRDNLRALMIAGSDGDDYGKILAYQFPRDQQVYGPAQINSLVNQDVVISEMFTLWDQEGSDVILGKMVIEPSSSLLLYIQPVYLQEEGSLKIPQLKRLIMALEDAVVMAPSLEEAAVMLEAELARKSTNRDRRFTNRPGADAAETPPAEDAVPQETPENGAKSPSVKPQS